jgi:hypothetical protein
MDALNYARTDGPSVKTEPQVSPWHTSQLWTIVVLCKSVFLESTQAKKMRIIICQSQTGEKFRKKKPCRQVYYNPYCSCAKILKYSWQKPSEREKWEQERIYTWMRWNKNKHQDGMHSFYNQNKSLPNKVSNMVIRGRNPRRHVGFINGKTAASIQAHVTGCWSIYTLLRDYRICPS